MPTDALLPKPERQQRYVDALKERGNRLPLVNTEVFIESVRDSGYRSTATALDELVDNAREADATRVDVVLGYEPDAASTKMLNAGGMIAVADNGHGMHPEVIRLAVMWGGTHRHNSRSGFGRYGFGLPSASASIARRFTVYSKTAGQPWHRVRIDVDEVANRKLTDEHGMVITPLAEPAEPPTWVTDVTGSQDHGTVVVLERLDRLSPGFVQSASFRRNILNHFGLIYRGVLREMTVTVTDSATGKPTEVTPVDPLFLTPDARFYDETPVHAEALPEARFFVPDPDNPKRALGAVRVRYSYMPPGFQGETQADAKASARYRVMKENNGIIILRAGRQIDVLRTVPDEWSISIGQVYDRNWGCEVDFEPTLDEEFGITVNKQQAALSESMWSRLKDAGVMAAIAQMRARYQKARAELRETRQRDETWEPKTSERVAQKAAKFKTRKPENDRPVDTGVEDDGPLPSGDELDAFLRGEAERQAKATGRDPKDILDDMLHGGSYVVDYEDVPGGPPYRPERYGALVKLLVNTDHRFFQDVYAAPWLPSQARTALEVFLFALVDAELDAPPKTDRRRFYKRERSVWGQRLDTMLDILDEEDPQVDAEAAEAGTAGL